MEVRGHVGAAEAVDRLLGVADEAHDAPRARGAGLDERAPEDGPLRVVGVLELVDEGVAPPPAHGLAERGASRTAKPLVDQREHVVEVVASPRALAAHELVAHGPEQCLGERRGERRRGAGEIQRGDERLRRRSVLGHDRLELPGELRAAQGAHPRDESGRVRGAQRVLGRIGERPKAVGDRARGARMHPERLET